MKPILCIDPGASGGLALLNREGIVEAFPMRDGMTGQIDAIRHIAAADETFSCVVFDPPHRVSKAATGNLLKFYGCLNGDWKEMLRRGFAECFRVLKPNGTLVFKWCDSDVPLREILALTPEKPLVGNRKPATSKTHWILFMKEEK